MARVQHGSREPRRWWPAAVVVGLVLGIVYVAGVGIPPSVPAAPTAQAVIEASVAPSEIPLVDAPTVTSPAPPPGPVAGFDDAKYSIDDPASPWVVVNKHRPLEPLGFAPDDLTQPAGVVFSDGGSMRAEAADALGKMKAAAQHEGVSLRVSSAYRAYDRQQEIYVQYAARYGSSKADTFSARAGYSEHQTGWSADVYDTEACRLKECFAKTRAGLWVAAHAPQFGFIVRYPDGESNVTGYTFEPWHLRYVGVGLATEMRDRGTQTLEEFFGLDPAPGYLTP